MFIGLSLTQLMVRIAALVVIIAVHGFVVAWIAGRLGDRGPKHDGRATLSPLAHLDLLGVLATLFGRTGWIKPIDIDAREMRAGRAGLVVVVAGGLLAVLALGAAALLLRAPVTTSLPPDYTVYALLILSAIGELSAWFVVFNLIPLPPLTGGYLLQAVAPGVAAVLVRQAVWIGLALVVFQYLTRGAWLQPVVEPLLALISP